MVWLTDVSKYTRVAAPGSLLVDSTCILSRFDAINPRVIKLATDYSQNRNQVWSHDIDMILLNTNDMKSQARYKVNDTSI